MTATVQPAAVVPSASSTGYIPFVQATPRVETGVGAGGGVGGVMTLKSGQRSFLAGRVLVWFSRGAASTIALKLAVEKYGANGIEALYCPIKQEHKDGERFARDVGEWLGVEIKELRSKEFPAMDIYEVFRKHSYISGIGGARCTRSLKREVRMAYQWDEDTHVFGYTADETARVRQFERDNPALFCDWLLAEAGIVKADCYRIIQDAGITLPLMYRMGYRNHNCICCVKGGAGYQNKCRRDFPEEFAEMARVSRAMGVKLVKVNGVRIFLDELPPDAGRYQDEPDFDCGPQCVLPPSDDDAFESEVVGRAAGAGVGLEPSPAEKQYNGADGPHARRPIMLSEEETYKIRYALYELSYVRRAQSLDRKKPSLAAAANRLRALADYVITEGQRPIGKLTGGTLSALDLAATAGYPRDHLARSQQH